jgi:hypothetical protein
MRCFARNARNASNRQMSTTGLRPQSVTSPRRSNSRKGENNHVRQGHEALRKEVNSRLELNRLVEDVELIQKAERLAKLAVKGLYVSFKRRWYDFYLDCS